MKLLCALFSFAPAKTYTRARTPLQCFKAHKFRISILVYLKKATFFRYFIRSNWSLKFKKIHTESKMATGTSIFNNFSLIFASAKSQTVSTTSKFYASTECRSMLVIWFSLENQKKKIPDNFTRERNFFFSLCLPSFRNKWRLKIIKWKK